MEKPEGKIRSEDLGIDRRNIVKWGFNEQNVRTWTGFVLLRMGSMAACFEHGNDTFGFNKRGSPLIGFSTRTLLDGTALSAMLRIQIARNGQFMTKTFAGDESQIPYVHFHSFRFERTRIAILMYVSKLVGYNLLVT